MTKAESTTMIKPCNSCIYSRNGKCPLVCQLSLFCPLESEKPVLSRIKRQKDYVMQQFETYFTN